MFFILNSSGKKQKIILLLSPSCVLFANLRSKKNFSGTCACFTLLFLNLYWCAKFQKKTNGQIPKKVGYRLTGIKMNNQQTSINS